MDFPINDIWIASARDRKSMQEFGRIFVSALPKHIQVLQIPGRRISTDAAINSQLAKIDKIVEIQRAMQEVLVDPITRQAESHAENTFKAFLEKRKVDVGLLKFLNGWYGTHKTTSLVSAKIIMRLAGDAIFIPLDQQIGYCKAMAHMHEVAKDDFGLGHKGHDGMYIHMTAALKATDWAENKYEVLECNEFSDFLYETGVAEHKSLLNSDRHNESILKAMMISIASKIWNGREFNYIAQYIEEKIISVDPALANEATSMRNAKGYVAGHAGEVENKHGLHALAAAQIFARTRGVEFRIERLKEVMLEYNERVGRAFWALHRALM
ncbi:hypothetical protein [Pararobbsia alpina]|uniref:Uncharacterized protein n=1 Tax=Pararobbsia alpina TaxID=621374 RepID=A0A6S7B3N1_9BURK|nr:hypothetical protein [Pararobbsia alpina]CAB3786642.1 hypothetical protein LMG28138_02265 [Pararobbsia alpina]